MPFANEKKPKRAKRQLFYMKTMKKSALTYLPLRLCSFIENTATRISYPVVFQILEILPEMWTHVPVIDNM